MAEPAFTVRAGDGEIGGWRTGTGPPALVLHGGPGALRLPAARCPFVFVHGRGSPIPWQRSAESAALVPGARLELVEECGHFPWLEQPGSLAGALARAGLP